MPKQRTGTPGKKAAPPRKRRLSPKGRRALELLANNPLGVSEAFMLALGFTRRMLIGLVRAGLAMRLHTTVREGGRTIDVTYVMITDAGRRALQG